MHSDTIRSRQIGMLQMDLNKHSELSQVMAPGLLMEAKMELARDIEYHLRSKRLALLGWSGDGGIFWIECSRLPDFDAVVQAGELVFHVLRHVNGLYVGRFPEGRELSLRVSAHFGSILTVAEPRFWHGRDLNFFAKNERHLSEPGMFSITKQLRDTLSQEQRMKFPESRSIVKEIDSERTVIYFHEGYGEFVPIFSGSDIATHAKVVTTPLASRETQETAH
jgi:hypothetical protein